MSGVTLRYVFGDNPNLAIVTTLAEALQYQRFVSLPGDVFLIDQRRMTSAST